jgi:NifB/MoaA-like Fe-S oxidoreductase
MGWTCNGFAGAPKLRHALMRAPTPTAALELLQRAQEHLDITVRPSTEHGA